MLYTLHLEEDDEADISQASWVLAFADGDLNESLERRYHISIGSYYVMVRNTFAVTLCSPN
jgi:hypothetical protein